MNYIKWLMLMFSILWLTAMLSSPANAEEEDWEVTMTVLEEGDEPDSTYSVIELPAPAQLNRGRSAVSEHVRQNAEERANESARDRLMSRGVDELPEQVKDRIPSHVLDRITTDPPGHPDLPDQVEIPELPDVSDEARGRDAVDIPEMPQRPVP